MSNDDKLRDILLENSDVWKTSPEFFSWVRGGIRKGLWNRHPVKIKLLNKLRIKIDNPNPKGRVKQVFGAQCNLCKGYFAMKDIQVDHKDGGDYSLKTIDDVDLFFRNIILVTEDDLQLLCKECNSTCTYAKRNNISIEESFIIKYVIKMIKEKTINNFFKDRNLPIPKNLELKRSQAIEILTKENKESKNNV